MKDIKMEPKIFIGYAVCGFCDVETWNDQKVEILMDQTFIPKYTQISKKVLLKSVNTGGISVKNINLVKIDIYKIYMDPEDKYKAQSYIFERTIKLNLNQCIRYQNYFRKG